MSPATVARPPRSPRPCTITGGHPPGDSADRLAAELPQGGEQVARWAALASAACRRACIGLAEGQMAVRKRGRGAAIAHDTVPPWSEGNWPPQPTTRSNSKGLSHLPRRNGTPCSEGDGFNLDPNCPRASIITRVSSLCKHPKAPTRLRPEPQNKCPVGDAFRSGGRMLPAKALGSDFDIGMTAIIGVHCPIIHIGQKAIWMLWNIPID